MCCFSLDLSLELPKEPGLCFPSPGRRPASSVCKAGGVRSPSSRTRVRGGRAGAAFPPFEVAGAGFQGARDTPGHVAEQEASGMLGGFQRTGEMLGSGSPGGLGFPVCLVSC